MTQIFLKLPVGPRRIKKFPIAIQLDSDGEKFLLTAPYDPLLLDEFRNLKDAKWDKDNKQWIVPVNERNCNTLLFLQKQQPRLVDYSSNRTSFTSSLRPLMQHQKEGIDFVLHTRQCMLAFEMGLGKTLTCIEIMEHCACMHSISHWWLIAPWGAQQEWKRQLSHWRAKIYPIVTTTYESLHNYMDHWPEHIPPQGIIVDESIKVKNPHAQRSQVMAELCRIIREDAKNKKFEPFIIFLSGSPASHSPEDWWHQIECIYPGWLREPNIYKFRERYANLVEVDHGYGPHKQIVSWKQDELLKLGKRLAPIVLVKKKSDCMDLPDKIYDIIRTTPSEELISVAKILVNTAKSALEALEKVRELSDGFQYKIIHRSEVNIYEECHGGIWLGSPKLDILKELLDFYHTENGGCGRLIVYAAFHATIDKLKEFVHEQKWHVARIDGRGWSDRDCLKFFEEPEVENYCIVANPACVHGLTFAKTNALVYYSNSFSTDARIQSEDRRDRPGMDTSKGTRIVDILNLDTDELILNRLKEKRELQSITLEEIRKCLVE